MIRTRKTITWSSRTFVAFLRLIAGLARSRNSQISISPHNHPAHSRTGTTTLESSVSSACPEQELRNSEERLRVLFEFAPDAYYLCDLKGTFVDGNLAAEELSGYRRDELIGKNFLQLSLLPPRQIPKAAALLARNALGQPTGPDEFTLNRKDGDQVELEIRTYPVKIQERRLVISIARDVTQRKLVEGEQSRIQDNLKLRVKKRTAELAAANEQLAHELTERKVLEEQLAQSQKMEAIGKAAGGIAHDFNNLLTPIMGYSQMVMNDLPQESEARTRLQEIYDVADRAALLVRQLLSFSRQDVIEPQVIDVGKLISNMDSLIRRLIGGEIEFATRIDPDLGFVRIDPGQIEQVVVNLAVNARDAMPGGGRLVVEVKNVRLGEEFARTHPDHTIGDYVAIVVRDNGTGMTEEVKSRAFEPFFTTKDLGKGTGLGLAICYGILTQNKGYILVDTSPDEGTTINVYLPIVEGQPAIPNSENEPATLQGGNETILLVEDEPSVREVTCQILREQGYTVLEAKDGNEGLRLARLFSSQTVHMLLADLVLPQTNGMDLADQFLKLHPKGKVLVSTGFTDDNTNKQAPAPPCNALLQKPYSPQELAKTVRTVLDGSS